jgi:citrate synthase
LRLLTAIAANTPSAIAGIAETLQQSWLPQQPQAVKFIKTALILCADHELNVSSFTARCVASARSTPYQVVIAGLAALQGARHGRETERFEVFLEEVGSPAQAQVAVVNRLKRGESVPGCGHPLYPQGDPRAKVLLQMTQENYPEAPVVALVTAIGEAAQAVMGEYLTLDAGLVTVSQALNLPPGGAITLFALGRTIGWIGHALEAYEDNRLIRPRAKYVGTPPRQE